MIGRLSSVGRLWTLFGFHVCERVSLYVHILYSLRTGLHALGKLIINNSYCELNSYDTLGTSHKWFLILATTPQLVIYHCISFLFLHKKSSTCLLLLSIGQRSRHNTAGLSAQADQAETKVLAGAAVLLEAQLLFQPHSRCWQNWVPWGARTEGPIFLLAVGQWLFSASTGHPQILAMWLSHSKAASSKPAVKRLTPFCLYNIT